MLSLKEFSVEICETATAGLAAKASKSGVSIGTLRKVYNRGMAAWKTGHRPGTTPQQWAMARVNSYIGKGSGTYHGADKDLREGEQIDELNKDTLKSYLAKKTNKPGLPTQKDVDGMANATVRLMGKKPTSEEVELEENNLPEVPKDKESGLPKKYVAGLSDATSKSRAAHFKANDKKSDSDPTAYKPAPGDADAKTKPSKHTLKYRAMFGEDMDEELYEACWDSHKQVGLKKKGDKMVPDCVPKNEEVELSEGTADELADKIDNAKSTEHSKSIIAKSPTKHLQYLHHHNMGLSGVRTHKDMPHIKAELTKRKSLLSSAESSKRFDEEVELDEKSDQAKQNKTMKNTMDASRGARFKLNNPVPDRDAKHKTGQAHNVAIGRALRNEEVEAQFDLIESVVQELALIHNLDSEYIWEKFEQFTDEELLEYAVDAKGHKSSSGGLTQKGRDAYNAKGANLQAPVTTAPSKLKAGSKAANRRKSFCARMGGMEGPMKKPNGEPTRKALALRKWNC